MTSPPEPKTIQKLVDVYPSFALLAGMQLDLFTPLKAGPMRPEQIANVIGVDVAKLKPLLYALVAAELLTVEGDRFANTDEANHFLVRGSPSYMGGVHTLYADLWDAALQTAESIRTGQPQAKHDYTQMPHEALETFYPGFASGCPRNRTYTSGKLRALILSKVVRRWWRLRWSSHRGGESLPPYPSDGCRCVECDTNHSTFRDGGRRV